MSIILTNSFCSTVVNTPTPNWMMEPPPPLLQSILDKISQINHERFKKIKKYNFANTAA